MPGTILDLDEVYEDIEKFIDENEYEVFTVGYDPLQRQRLYVSLGEGEWPVWYRKGPTRCKD